MGKQGAYLLYFRVKQSLTLNVGGLQHVCLPKGRYVYVGSARAGIEKRIARHRRLALDKAGKLHWHIDYLLVHSEIVLTGKRALAGDIECSVSRRIASRKGVQAPVRGFGASDCRAGCKAHLYRLG
jgi:Uri superfamily endonuclease